MCCVAHALCFCSDLLFLFAPNIFLISVHFVNIVLHYCFQLVGVVVILIFIFPASHNSGMQKSGVVL